jgi:hypothetical protein
MLSGLQCGAAAVHLAAGKAGGAFARQRMHQEAAMFDLDGDGAGRQRDRIGVYHQAHVGLLRR